MAASPYSARPVRRLALDWILAIVALIAIAVIVGSAIQLSVEPRDRYGPNAVGLRALSNDDRLIAFEDYSFDGGGWSGRTIDKDDAAQGSVLGPIADETLSREFALPRRTHMVLFAFDTVGLQRPSELTVAVQNAVIGDVQTRPETAGRLRHWVAVATRDRTVTLDLSAPDGVAWALDNLTVTAALESQGGDS